MNDDRKYELFVRLFLKHESELLRTALIYVPSRSDARDIVQESAVAIWKQFSQYDQSRPFVAWACGYVRIEVKRFLRNMRKRTLLSERAADVLAAAESNVTAESEERQRALQDCIEDLPQKQRKLIRGYYLDERSVASLANEQCRTIEAIYKSLQRIRGALLECIEFKIAEA